MTRTWRRCALLLALALSPALALAQSDTAQDVPRPPLDTEQPDLYLEAMQAISDGRRDDAGTLLNRMSAQVGANAANGNAGEWLDLALLQCALGNEAAAFRLFDDIATRFAPPQGILDIIAQTRTQGCYKWKPLRQWSFGAGRGHDTNVNQGASSPVFELSGNIPVELLPEYLPHADGYTQLTADFITDLSERGDLGFLQAHTRRHDSLSTFDTASLYAGVDRPWRLQRWKLRGTALLGALWLDGKLYQRLGQLQMRVTPPLPLPPSMELNVMAGVTHLSYQSLTSFDANTLELRGTLRYRSVDWQGQFSGAVLNDHALGDRPGGDRSGWNMGLYGRKPLFGKLEGEFDLTRQQWRGDSVYAQDVIDIKRRQNTTTGRATLIYPLSSNSSLQLEWRRVHNNENISLFQYDSRQIQLSWHWRDGR